MLSFVSPVGTFWNVQERSLSIFLMHALYGVEKEGNAQLQMILSVRSSIVCNDEDGA
jgi:hypothetical protein